MRAPDFWARDGLAARLLAPASAFWAWSAVRRLARNAPAFRAAIPVVCVGNVVAGGAGKTPVALSLLRRLRAQGREVHALTRGYGGTEIGPRLVDPVRHDAARVGDEALLLAAEAPTWVARWRPDGAIAAAELGAEMLVMDDGFQNGSLAKTLSLVVVDGGYGFGNGRVIPAGPCREPIKLAMARADAIVLVGEDTTGVSALLTRFDLPVLRAGLVPDQAARALAGRKIVAFAGIGRPAKFFSTLRALGAEIFAAHSFADHHRYRAAEFEDLAAEAEDNGATLVTTAKDAVRIPASLRRRVTIVAVDLAWEDEAALDRVFAKAGL